MVSSFYFTVTNLMRSENIDSLSIHIFYIKSTQNRQLIFYRNVWFSYKFGKDVEQYLCTNPLSFFNFGFSDIS